MRVRAPAKAIVLNPKAAPFFALWLVWEIAGCVAGLGIAGRIVS